MDRSRIERLEQIYVDNPGDAFALYALAKEYEKAGLNEDLIDTLTRYLASSDDEGNAYGMLASAYEKAGNRMKAREVYQRGVEAALAHGHPSMAEEYRQTLASDYAD